MYCKSLKCSLLALVLFSYLNCVVFCCCCGCCCLNFVWVGCSSSSSSSSSSKALQSVSWSECSNNQSIFISFLLYKLFYESTLNKEYITSLGLNKLKLSACCEVFCYFIWIHLFVWTKKIFCKSKNENHFLVIVTIYSSDNFKGSTLHLSKFIERHFWVQF